MLSFKSQIGQDRWVCDMLEFKRGGYFVDIGAFDGVQISNTYYLEKNLEWSGICVEAGATNFKELQKNRSCVCLNMAVTNTNGWVEFSENWTVGKVGPGIKVESITIDRLLTDWRCPLDIDYISLDIEGMEFEALKLFPFDKYKVTLWTIEHNAHEDGGVMRDNIRELMCANGYKIARSLSFEDWYDNK